MSPKTTPLTGLPVGEIPPSVLVCGDPARSEMAANNLTNARLLSDRREYRCFVGHFGETPIAICSHGIGAPGAAIAFEELIFCGAKRIIRVGTCGALQPGVKTGDLIIATAAVQNTGYGLETVPAGYPPVADLGLTSALIHQSASADQKVWTGIILSRDNFYRGVNPVSSPDYNQLSAANVLAVEMECAALFIVGSIRGIQTAAILAVDGNVLESGGEDLETYNPHHNQVEKAIRTEILIALRALEVA